MKELRAIFILFIAILFYNSQAQNCLNDGFESMSVGQYTAGNSVPGWSLSGASSTDACQSISWNSGSDDFWIVPTPIINWGSGTLLSVPMPIIPQSPLGGLVVAQLNDFDNSDIDVTRLSQTLQVTSSNSLYQFAYAGIWEGNDACCFGPGLKVKVYSCGGSGFSCFDLSIHPDCPSAGVTFTNGYSNGQNNKWSNWQVKFIDLSPFIGTCITIEFIINDCGVGTHRGVALLDVVCASQNFTPAIGSMASVDYCFGSSQAQLNAPLGYATYSWVAPSGAGIIPISQATLSSATATNVLAGGVYTLNLSSYTGCTFITTVAISPSGVYIAQTHTVSSCIGGATGSATVVPGGSGTSYSYTWTTASNSVIGSSSVVANLVPGTYSVFVTSSNTGTCGAASSTVSINAAQQAPTGQIKPYCQQAYLGVASGTNVQWYAGPAAIAGSLGGTSPNYTVSNPCNACLYSAAYTSSLGCRDSTIFYLSLSSPGVLSYGTILETCVNANTGIATILLPQLPNSIPGANTFSVWSNSTVSPVYSSSISGSSSYSFVSSGMPAGLYNVYAFDGFCYYNSQFNVSTYVFDYTVSPQNATVCSGSNLTANVTISLPYSFTYSWTPTTFFLSGNTSTAALMQPTVSPGAQGSFIFSVIATPTAVNCPLTKTISISVLNPSTPTINTVPVLCSSSVPYTITVSPSGGIFQSGAANPIDPLTGIITPSLANIGLNTFTYAVSEYTCPVMTATSSYYVNQTISAALNTNTIPLLCEFEFPLNLMNFALNSGGNWSMTAVPGFTPVQNNVFSPAGLPTNSYVLTYTTDSNPPGCTDASTLLVSVLNPPTPTISIVNGMCTNAMPVQMMASPIGGVWSGGPYINASGEFIPALGSAGLNPVLYAVGNGTCNRFSQTDVKLEAFVSAAFAKPIAPFCRESAPVDLNGYVTNPGGQWSLDGVNLSGSIFDPGTFTTTSMSSIVYQTHSVPTATLCPDTRTVMVEVRSLVASAFQNISTKACAPVEVTLTTQEIQDGIGSWNFSDGSPSQSGFSVTHFFGQAGTYTVSFEYSDAIGCKSPPRSEQIVVHNPPKAEFTFSEEIYSYDPSTLMINSSVEPDSNFYSWLIDLSLASNDKNPKLTFPSVGSYSVTLIANSLYNCSSEITHLVTVKNDFSVFIPNSFTPNGDGLNDVFSPVFTNDNPESGSFQIEIFDRWGHSIFKSNDPHYGWNGAFQNKGETLKTGVYVYLLDYKGPNGKNNKRTGHVNLSK